MQVGQPSRTALATAYARAYHQVADEPRVFVDPLALRIAGAAADELTRWDTGLDPELARQRRLFLAGRSRFAEDAVAQAVAAGTGQVVVLGAGLDTFGCRNPYAGVRVFEVDHPSTQAWKHSRLAEADIVVPETLTFAPVDFENESLADGLAAAGFDREAPAVFVWLGVVMYLTRDAIMATLRYIADQNAATVVVFDYLYPPSSDQTGPAQQERANRVAAAGEPWLTFFTAQDVADDLRAIGFDEIEDLSAPALLAGYLSRPAPPPRDAGPHVVRAARR
jgi:methyltransferase (TIGR00027 family)